MIGLLLLVISLIFYFSGKKKYSLLIFLSFMTQGLRVFTDDFIGIKNGDLAFIYTIIICLYSAIFEKNIKPTFNDQVLKKFIGVFFLFLCCSVLFSRYYYEFTWIQILQGGRHHFLFLSYYFLRKTKKQDVLWVIRVLFYFTCIHSILYCIQVLTQLPVLPYGDANIDSVTGIARYYNSPVFLGFFLYLCVIYPKSSYIKYPKSAIVILLAALICTQGRTGIALTIFGVLLGLLYKGYLKKIVKNIILLGIISLPFADMVLARFNNEGETNSDLEEIITGKFIERAYSGNMQGGTMAYRFAWVYERVDYLNDRPIGENIFGLGMISDSQYDVVLRKYRFNMGLTNEETGEPTQLATPDIAYGNMLTQFGYVGGVILLCIWIRLFILFYKNRQQDELIFCMALFIFNYIIGSISGNAISSTGNLIIPFVMLATLPTNIKSYK